MMDDFWVDLPMDPERQAAGDDGLEQDLAGTGFARRAAAHSPYARTHADARTDGDEELGVYPEIGPVPEPWAIPDPPTGLPVLPPDGGLPPL